MLPNRSVSIQLQQIVLFMCIGKAFLSPQEGGVTVSFQDFIGGRGWERVIIICERAFRLPRPKKMKMYGVTVGDK